MTYIAGMIYKDEKNEVGVLCADMRLSSLEGHVVKEYQKIPISFNTVGEKIIVPSFKRKLLEIKNGWVASTGNVFFARRCFEETSKTGNPTYINLRRKTISLYDHYMPYCKNINSIDTKFITIQNINGTIFLNYYEANDKRTNVPFDNEPYIFTFPTDVMCEELNENIHNKFEFAEIKNLDSCFELLKDVQSEVRKVSNMVSEDIEFVTIDKNLNKKYFIK